MKERMMTRTRIDDQTLLRLLTRRAYFKQHGLCYHCNEFVPRSAVTGDHLIPRYMGGQTRHGNIVASCFECNNQRNRETDRHGGRLNVTVGDNTPRSPFEILKKLKEEMT
jgi:5-methylcytosine-specific restriction endonuclease McrA